MVVILNSLMLTHILIWRASTVTWHYHLSDHTASNNSDLQKWWPQWKHFFWNICLFCFDVLIVRKMLQNCYLSWCTRLKHQITCHWLWSACYEGGIDSGHWLYPVVLSSQTNIFAVGAFLGILDWKIHLCIFTVISCNKVGVVCSKSITFVSECTWTKFGQVRDIYQIRISWWDFTAIISLHTYLYIIIGLYDC